MQGRRVDAKPEDAGQYPFPRLQAGDYGKDVDGIWYCCPPPPWPTQRPGNLSKHKVEEHADGTITVTPSILIGSPTGSWHGYLERGKWRMA